jgi:hypothetical protein
MDNQEGLEFFENVDEDDVTIQMGLREQPIAAASRAIVLAPPPPGPMVLRQRNHEAGSSSDHSAGALFKIFNNDHTNLTIIDTKERVMDDLNAYRDAKNNKQAYVEKNEQAMSHCEYLRGKVKIVIGNMQMLVDAHLSKSECGGLCVVGVLGGVHVHIGI